MSLEHVYMLTANQLFWPFLFALICANRVACEEQDLSYYLGCLLNDDEVFLKA